MERIYTQNWIELPKEVRNHLSKTFAVTRTGLTEVRDQTLISDGTSNDDLAKAFTKETLSKYTGSPITDPFAHLWNVTVSKAKYEINPPVDLSALQQSLAAGIELKEVSNEEFFAANPHLKPQPVEVPWCEFCDAKGIRHNKDCTKPGVVDGFERREIPEEIIPESEVTNV